MATHPAAPAPRGAVLAAASSAVPPQAATAPNGTAPAAADADVAGVAAAEMPEDAQIELARIGIAVLGPAGAVATM